MAVLPQSICNKWILKPLDPVKAIMLFDGVSSSCNLIRGLMVLVLTMALSISSFLLGVFFFV